MRRTKIICTLGPSTDNERHLLGMVEKGMNIARLNMSHGLHADHERRAELVRKAGLEQGRCVPLLFDIQGPKIRTGMFKGSRTMLRDGSDVVLTVEKVDGDEHTIPIDYVHLPAHVKPEQKIFLADGLLELKVKKVTNNLVHCTVIVGGEISNRKGVNLPGVDVPLPILSDKDKDDLKFAMGMKAEFIALSFVRTAQEIRDLRKALERNGSKAAIVAKIENAIAYANIDSIIAEADAVMVARGDLGVQLPCEDIPLVQKTIVSKCNLACKPVIIATQMLESMTISPQPTRAEVSDVANAVLDGADAVMLSGETASGKHPSRVVEMMDRIVRKTEGSMLRYDRMKELDAEIRQPNLSQALAKSACYIARDLRANAIVAFTHSGITARYISMYRPYTPLIAASSDENIVRRLELSWGVNAVLISNPKNTEELINKAVGKAAELNLVGKGDLVVIAATSPVETSGATNFIKAHTV